jgi:hypothetical protein
MFQLERHRRGWGGLASVSRSSFAAWNLGGHVLRALPQIRLHFLRLRKVIEFDAKRAAERAAEEEEEEEPPTDDEPVV